MNTRSRHRVGLAAMVFLLGSSACAAGYGRHAFGYCGERAFAPATRHVWLLQKR
ncbi:MAG: hypothetical protein ACR2G6_08630 [Gemmatimonadaceae bacterium]